MMLQEKGLIKKFLDQIEKPSRAMCAHTDDFGKHCSGAGFSANTRTTKASAQRQIEKSVCVGGGEENVKKEEDESILGNYKTCNFRCPLIAFEVERKTGLEPATLTLARLCSTN